MLPNTRIIDGSGASLDLGGFGYKLTDPGPGVLISYLPRDYIGPLKTGDRLIELDGQPVEDARDFDARLNKMYAEKLMVALDSARQGTVAVGYARRPAAARCDGHGAGAG